MTAPVLVREEAAFKFAADETILHLLVSKQCPRGSGAKFITVYPTSPSEFLKLIELIHLATTRQTGPYILSDRRYKDSKCVFYRYGGFVPKTTRRIDGQVSQYLVSPDGEQIEDRRRPWFVLPSWVDDLFPKMEGPSSTAKVLKKGRYEIRGALRFSNSGGIYSAVDKQNGEKVVIKEARPFVNLQPSGDDAIGLLRKEFRILTKIESARIAPRPIDLFEQWEHCFLVEEYLDGVTLRIDAGTHSIASLAEPTPEDVCTFCEHFKSIFLSLAELLSTLHQCGIVFRDLSPKNIMILERGKAKLLDFEAACEIGVDPLTTLFTPGFAAAEHFRDQFARFENDYFALGALMLSYLMPVHSLVGLDPSALARFASSVADDYGVPDNFRRTVLALLQDNPDSRPAASEVMATLKKTSQLRPMRIYETGLFNPAEYQEFARDLVNYILGTATYDREDRLFPSDPKTFVTNPLSLAYGACGVAYAIERITGELPEKISDWILKHEVTPELYPPGMYVGMAGIAWALLELGFADRAEKILLASRTHPLLFESIDVFYGLAGWGMANLKFFVSLAKQVYLDRATEAGEFVLKNQVETDEGVCWNASDERWIGFGHGSSGIALFLLYLYLATGNVEFLSVAERALRFDLNQKMHKRGGLSWPVHKGEGASVVPYWRYGSAGVGTSLLRFLSVSKVIYYQETLQDIVRDTARKYAIFPGKFFGLAGLGDFLLDVADLGGEHLGCVEGAWKVAAGIRLFQVNPNGAGPAFPGANLWKISCDYGTGGAGIGLFLNRLVTRRRCDFMIDELLPGSKAPELANSFIAA